MKSLTEIAEGKSSIVRQLGGGKDFLSRMAALGFTIGAQVKIIQNSGRGPMIILVRNSRIALGRGEALKVLVDETDEQA
jgi:ferrous iron transport protein A